MPGAGAYPGSFNPLTVAHLAIAEAALHQCGLDRVDLVVSRVALGKETVGRPAIEHRVEVLRRAAGRLPWLGVVLTGAQLVADVAEGYDVVVLGADKWAQILDPAFYGGSARGRDEAVARLPLVALASRPPHPGPGDVPGAGAARVQLLEVPGAHGVSSSGARAGRRAWMAAEAADFDDQTGAWSDPERYSRWLAAGEVGRGGVGVTSPEQPETTDRR